MGAVMGHHDMEDGGLLVESVPRAVSVSLTEGRETTPNMEANGRG